MHQDIQNSLNNISFNGISYLHEILSKLDEISVAKRLQRKESSGGVKKSKHLKMANGVKMLREHFDFLASSCFVQF